MLSVTIIFDTSLFLCLFVHPLVPLSEFIQPHGKIRPLLDGFSRNFYLNIFRKFIWKKSHFIKI